MLKMEWEAPEFEHRPKDTPWLWLSIIISVLMLAIAVWQANFLFGFFIVIAEMLVLYWGNAEPRNVKFVLSEKYILIDGRKHYNLSELAGFSVDELEHKDLVTIFIHFKQRFKAHVHVHIQKDKLAQFKEIMLIGVKEIPHEDSIIDSLEHLAGF